MGETTTYTPPLAEEPPEELAEQHLRMLVEQMPAIVWTADGNRRLTSILGAGLEHIGERGVIDIDMTAGLGARETAVTSIAARTRALTGHRSTYTAAWDDRVYECRVEPLQSDGQIVGSIGVAVDVTEQRQAERDTLFAYEEAIQVMMRAIELRDIGTGIHAEHMSGYCTILAEAIGMSPEERHAFALASRLHDIGKITVSDGILLKPGPLTSDEWQVMRGHCESGHQILANSRSKILGLAALIALTHHEWWDGSGYPKGLAGEEIPIAGRIAAIADAFEALTSDRPYRPALSFEDARGVLLKERETHFDPTLVDLFLSSDALPQMFQGYGPGGEPNTMTP